MVESRSVESRQPNRAPFLSNLSGAGPIVRMTNHRATVGPQGRTMNDQLTESGGAGHRGVTPGPVTGARAARISRCPGGALASTHPWRRRPAGPGRPPGLPPRRHCRRRAGVRLDGHPGRNPRGRRERLDLRERHHRSSRRPRPPRWSGLRRDHDHGHLGLEPLARHRGRLDPDHHRRRRHDVHEGRRGHRPR